MSIATLSSNFLIGAWRLGRTALVYVGLRMAAQMVVFGVMAIFILIAQPGSEFKLTPRLEFIDMALGFALIVLCSIPSALSHGMSDLTPGLNIFRWIGAATLFFAMIAGYVSGLLGVAL